MANVKDLLVNGSARVIGTIYGNATSANKVNHSLTFGSKSFNGSSAQTITLADLGGKPTQAAVSSPSASGTAISFIDTISQNANGVITATKKTVRDASASQSGVVNTGAQTFAGNKTFNNGITLGANIHMGSAGTPSSYPYVGNKITWDGGTDGAQIYYQIDSADAGRLFLNTTDDTNCLIALAYNGTAKSYINTSTPSFYPSSNSTGSIGLSSNKWASMYATTFYGALSGNATSATTATRLYGGSIPGWGTLTAANGYTNVSSYDYSDLGAYGIAGKGGQLSIQVDGFFYQNEGRFLVLDTNNYTNYAPTKTGGGASGTWGINISGNATTATTATNLSAAGTWTWSNGTTAGPTASLVLGGKTTSIGAIPSASATASGIITTKAQTIAGAKTIDGILLKTHQFMNNITPTAGWYRIAKLEGYQGYFNLLVFLHGWYNYGRPSTAIVHLSGEHNWPILKQIAGDSNSFYDKIRITGSGEIYYLEIYCNAISGGASSQYVSFIGSGEITETYVPTSPDGSTDAYTSTITLRTMKDTVTFAVADNSATNTGATVTYDSSKDIILKLPETIKATLTGNASTATTATNLAAAGTWTWSNGTTSGPTASLVLGGKTTSVGAIPSASSSISGIITTGDQSFAGIKTFTNKIVLKDGDQKGAKIGAAHITTASTSNGEVVLQNGHLRFGGSGWDYNQWAGLKYDHSNKKIVLGLADGSEFTANSAQSGGTFKLVGISTIDANKTASIKNLAVGGGIYWDPYVESASDPSDAASITVLKSGVAGGTELRISQANDANDIVNISVPTNNAARINNNIILNAANYTDYTVTKTGGGASGTWGISITGNAATATKAIQDGDGNVITSYYLPKTTYEYNKELSFGSSGKLCIGKFPMYDSNITVTISSTTNIAYHGTLVIATQNINSSGGGSKSLTVFGDPSGSLSNSIFIHYGSGSNVFSVYIDCPSWSKVLLHIQCVALAGTPTDIATSISSIPSDATLRPSNALTTATNTWAISTSGNAATATKATKDSDGNIISSTYLKKRSMLETGVGNVTSGTSTGIQSVLKIYGPTYGNEASYLKTSGKFSYGDPGPQIQFSASASGGQQAALIYTDHDAIGDGVSLSLITNENDAWFIAPHIKALTGFVGNLSGNATSANSSLTLSEPQLNKTSLTTYLDNNANIHKSSHQGEMNLYRFFASGDEANYATSYGLPAVDNHVLVFSIDGINNWERVIDLDIRSTDIFTRAKTSGTWGAWTKLLNTTNYAGTLDSRYVKKSGDTMTGSLILSSSFLWVQGGSAAGNNTNRLTTTSGMPGTMQYNQGRRGTQIYSNGIAFADPYNGNSNNDAAWIRHVEETANAGYLEIATGDDSDEGIYVRQYNTSNQIAKSITLMDASGYSTFIKAYGAVWNDYAEYRQSDITEPGRVVIENGDGTLSLSTKRLQRGAEVISDTYGFAIGETDECKTPIAATGRVLAYTYESIEEYRSKIGWPVCSGPNGTVSIMAEEEEEKYPSRIIGTISEVPDYEEWGTGKVKTNGRVWIRIK